MFQSAKYKDFSWTFLQKWLKLSTFPVPWEPEDFSGNKDTWEPWQHDNDRHMQCGAIITQSIFPTIFTRDSQWTPHISPSHASYGVSTASLIFDLCSAIVIIAVSNVILWQIWTCYNSAGLYFLSLFLNTYNILTSWVSCGQLLSVHRNDDTLIIHVQFISMAMQVCSISTADVLKPPQSCINTLRPREMAAISQTTLSNPFSWMKIFKFRLKFHWSLFLRFDLTIFQHRFR